MNTGNRSLRASGRRTEVSQPIRRTLRGEPNHCSSVIRDLPPLPAQEKRSEQPAELLLILEQLGGAAGLHGTRSVLRILGRVLALLDTVAQDALLAAADKEDRVSMEIDRIVATLPKRQRQVLVALKEGLAEKQIATRLEISHHTVHIYIKALYRRFNVNTRSELIALWLTEK